MVRSSVRSGGPAPLTRRAAGCGQHKSDSNIRHRSAARDMSDAVAAPLLSSGDDAPEDKYNLTYICFLVLGFGADPERVVFFRILHFVCACARLNLNSGHSFPCCPIDPFFHALYICIQQGAFC